MPTRPSLAAAGLAVAILVAVSACSSSSPTSAPTTGASTAGPTTAASAPPIEIPSALASALGPGASMPDPATLLTADQAASIIGGSPTPVTVPFNVPNMSIASYENTDGDSVTVFVEAIPGGVMGNAQLQAAMAMAGAQGDLQAISGLGDAAGKEVNANDATVAFVKGSTIVVVEASSGTLTGSDLEPKLEAIAHQVADKL